VTRKPLTPKKPTLKKPTLSPSRITTFLACPNKYVWTYVDSRGKWYLKAKSYYSFGTTLHKVLERFHNEGDHGVATVGDALQVYEESWIDAGYQSSEEMAEAYGEGRQIVERMGEDLQLKRELGIKTIAVEKLLKADLGAFVLVGRVDRLDEHPDGTIEIIDYKSGRMAVTEAEVASDFAMACYQLLLSKMYPEVTIRVTIHALRSGESASASLCEEDLRQFEQDILVLGAQILSTGVEDFTPTPKPLCEYCDFLALCKKNPNFLD
jgi:putative RecB family exonuclease